MVYSNGKIYRVICQETNRQYIGSTCNPLRKRLYEHKSKGEKSSAGDFINPIIVLIEDYPCERKEQLLMRERHFIETMDCVNKIRPIILKEERKEIERINSKNYRQNNKEIYNKKNREYRDKNKDKINKRNRERYAAAKELKNKSK